MKRFPALLLAALIVFLSPSVPAAQPEADLDQRAFEIFDTTMSPFCPGRLLRDCPSSAAGELKDDIRDRLAKGQSREAIMEELVAVYGDQVKAAPEIRGFGLLAWVAPFFFLAIGFLVILGWLAKKRSQDAPVHSGTPEISPDMRQRIEREIEGESAR